MSIVTISSDYRITIPGEIRKRFKLKPGQKLVFIAYGGMIHLIPQRPIEQARGMFKGISTDPLREKTDREI